jgi:signal transduction histidine kinase
VLTVQDDGKGFTAGVTSGIGLLGMRERMEELGGALAVIASPGNGTTIRANLPKTAMERK